MPHSATGMAPANQYCRLTNGETRGTYMWYDQTTQSNQRNGHQPPQRASEHDLLMASLPKFRWPDGSSFGEARPVRQVRQVGSQMFYVHDAIYINPRFHLPFALSCACASRLAGVDVDKLLPQRLLSYVNVKGRDISVLARVVRSYSRVW